MTESVGSSLLMYKLLIDQFILVDIPASVIVAFLCRFRGKLD
jgi:hypothetical protein